MMTFYAYKQCEIVYYPDFNLPGLSNGSDESDEPEPKPIKPDPNYCSCKHPKPKQVDTGMFSVWTICERCKLEIKE